MRCSVLRGRGELDIGRVGIDETGPFVLPLTGGSRNVSMVDLASSISCAIRWTVSIGGATDELSRDTGAESPIGLGERGSAGVGSGVNGPSRLLVAPCSLDCCWFFLRCRRSFNSLDDVTSFSGTFPCCLSIRRYVECGMRFA